MMSILFVAGEGLPYCKSGGLADVIGSLPTALQTYGCEVRVILPLYLKIARNSRENFKKTCQFTLYHGFFESVVTIYEEHVNDVCYYFVEHAPYFEREGMYGYTDDGERFAFFQLAVLEMLKQINYFPNVMHTHDWHTGMIPLLCKDRYGADARYQRIKHVYTIHNLAFQGNFPKEVLDSCLGLPQHYYNSGDVQFHDGISFMKAGIMFANKITTVSKTYAEEILTPLYGECMELVLEWRRQDLSGIVNGIDTKMWDPKTDECLEYPMRTKAAKKKNKLALQEQLGLRKTDDVMMLGMVTRLTSQKGIYLLLDTIEEIMANDVQLVILGNGDEAIENRLKELEHRYRRRVCFYCGYNEALAHRIYASSDVFLMPSLFEPCGISQLISLRYGTIPLVRETGGLKDTIEPYNEFTKSGVGFTFGPYQSSDFLFTVKRAIEFFYDRKEDWEIMMAHAQKQNVSWEQSALAYKALYESMM